MCYEPTPILMNQLIEKRFLVGQQIGKGSFGDVYEARDIIKQKKVAIKFESHKNTHAQLRNEYQVNLSMLTIVISYVNIIVVVQQPNSIYQYWFAIRIIHRCIS